MGLGQTRYPRNMAVVKAQTTVVRAKKDLIVVHKQRVATACGPLHLTVATSEADSRVL